MIRATALAAPAGLFAAVVQFAGALKSVPGLAGLPFDLTLIGVLLLAPCLALLGAGREWRGREDRGGGDGRRLGRRDRCLRQVAAWPQQDQRGAADDQQQCAERDGTPARQQVADQRMQRHGGSRMVVTRRETGAAALTSSTGAGVTLL